MGGCVSFRVYPFSAGKGNQTKQTQLVWHPFHILALDIRGSPGSKVTLSWFVKDTCFTGISHHLLLVFLDPQATHKKGIHPIILGLRPMLKGVVRVQVPRFETNILDAGETNCLHPRNTLSVVAPAGFAPTRPGDCSGAVS